MKIRQDAWSHEDDKLLADTVLRHIREGSTQLKAFDEVGDQLNRTSAACGFRWNAVIRSFYEKDIQQAKKDRKNRQRQIAAQAIGQTWSPPSSDTSKPMNLSTVISFLKDLAAETEENEKHNRAQLQEELLQLKEKNDQLKRELTALKTEYENIERDYKSMMTIMNRARRMAFLEEDDSVHSHFRMDKNGNLEKIAEA